MSNISSFLGGRGVSIQPTTRAFLRSGVFTALRDGVVRLTAVGAGASGGWAKSTMGINSGVNAGATGGSGPGYVPGVIFQVRRGDKWVVTLGAPGAGASGAAYFGDGNNGGDTTIVGPGIDVTVQGGRGGRAGQAPYQSLLQVPGVPGGIVLGCYGIQGGASGDISIEAAESGGVSGGGAVNLYDLEAQHIRSGSVYVDLGASGGASPGGGSADIDAGGARVSGGGGSGGPSVGTQGGPGTSSALEFLNAPGDLFRVLSSGLPGSTSVDGLSAGPGAGAASGGVVAGRATGTRLLSGSSSAFSGSGGAFNSSTSGSLSAASGASAFGGSSGGALFGRLVTSTTVSSGDGGPALVIIEEF